MKDETLKALNGSIEKWRKIANREGGDFASRNCQLCKIFEDTNCRGCPVMRNTGEIGCSGSPYEDWAEHQRDIHHVWVVGSNVPIMVKKRCKKCKELAQKELDFLISLSTKKEKKNEKKV